MDHTRFWAYDPLYKRGCAEVFSAQPLLYSLGPLSPEIILTSVRRKKTPMYSSPD